MNRKWLVGGVAGLLAIAAVLALVVGGLVGRSIVPSPAPERPATTRFTDTLTDISIAYPASWKRFEASDQAVRIRAASPDKVGSLSVSVRRSGLTEPVTAETLPIVRPLTDDLLRVDQRTATIGEPVAVNLGGLPGYRYTYTFRADAGGRGAHIHYFLFKDDRIVQLVLQALPAERLGSLQSTFDQIARTFRGRRD